MELGKRRPGTRTGRTSGWKRSRLEGWDLGAGFIREQIGASGGPRAFCPKQKEAPNSTRLSYK